MTAPRTNVEIEPASLIGDRNSGAARDSLVKALRMLPENVWKALHSQPIEVPGAPPSGGPSTLGQLLLSIAGEPAGEAMPPSVAPAAPRNRGVEDAITEGGLNMDDAVARRAARVKKRP